jgi:hypothetical protein
MNEIFGMIGMSLIFLVITYGIIIVSSPHKFQNNYK